MTVIKEPKKWYVKLFTLGKNFSSRTFSDNSKKFLLNAIGLFVVVTFTFYVENLGEKFESREDYKTIVKSITRNLNMAIKQSEIQMGEETDKLQYLEKVYNRWDTENDSIFIDFVEDEEEPNGKYYFTIMSQFGLVRSDFKPFPFDNYVEIFKSGDQKFKFIDPLATFYIDKVISGFEVDDINEMYKEANKIKEDFYQIVQKRWTRDLPWVDLDYNEFWIENRKYIQNDGEVEYLFLKIINIDYLIIEHLQEYIFEVKRDQKVLDSIASAYNNEKYFLYWKID